MKKALDKIEEFRRTRLQELVGLHGNIAKLAEKIDVTPGYISQLLNKYRPITEKTARKIEAALGLEENWFDPKHDVRLQVSLSSPSVSVNPKLVDQALSHGPELATMQTVPIVGTAEGGPDKQWEELGHPPGYGSEYVDAPSRDPNAYSLLVSGNSMAPRMRPGEAILVEPNHEPQPGDEVVVRLADGSTMVKIFTAKRGERVYLDSIGDHDTIVADASAIEFMHYVAGVFRAGSIKERT